MSRRVDAALQQIVTTYALMAPEAAPERVRAELTPYLEGLYAAGQRDVDALAIAGLARLRAQHQPA